MDNFLSSLRRLFPPPPANSHAETACSDTLTEAGYAHSDDENWPTVLSLDVFLLPHLHDGTGVPRVQYSYETFCARADINENYCAYLRNI